MEYNMEYKIDNKIESETGRYKNYDDRVGQ